MFNSQRRVTLISGNRSTIVLRDCKYVFALIAATEGVRFGEAGRSAELVRRPARGCYCRNDRVQGGRSSRKVAQMLSYSRFSDPNAELSRFVAQCARDRAPCRVGCEGTVEISCHSKGPPESIIHEWAQGPV